MLAQQPSSGWVRRDRRELSDEAADFDDFMNANWASLFRTAYLLTGDYQLAEDLLQTAFAKVFLSWSKISKMGQPVASTPARSSPTKPLRGGAADPHPKCPRSTFRATTTPATRTG